MRHGNILKMTNQHSFINHLLIDRITGSIYQTFYNVLVKGDQLLLFKPFKR